MTDQIDYTSKDYTSFRQSMLDTAAQKLPEWNITGPGDFGLVLVEAFAYVADILSFYGDRILNEAYLNTATQRESVIDIARMLDYEPVSTVASTVTLTFNIDTTGGAVTIPKGTRVSTKTSPDGTAAAVTFETDAEVATGAGSTLAATATQGVSVGDETLGSSDGSAGQQFALAATPVIQDSITVEVDSGLGFIEWTQFDHIIDATDQSQAFQVNRDGRGVAYIRLGDDVNGVIPPSGSTIRASYRVGGGVAGNVGAQTITEVLDAVTGVTGVFNTSPATGGVDEEAIDDIRESAVAALRTINRAVTLEDFRNLALTIPGVAKSYAEAQYATSVLLYIAPFGGGTPLAPLVAAIDAFFATRKLVGTDVTVLAPTYVPVNLDIDIFVADEFRRSSVVLAVETVLSNLLLLTNTDFAQRVATSDVYRLVSSVPGVLYATLNQLVRNDDADQNQTIDIVTLAGEIPSKGTVTVTGNGGIV